MNAKIAIEPNRIIEINHLGRFYVRGMPTYSVLKISDPMVQNGSRDGWIVIDESVSLNPYELNVLFKMHNNGTLIPALFKSQEMAEEVCFACNRIRV